MESVAGLIRKLQLLLHRQRFNRELEEELAFHREQVEQELRESQAWQRHPMERRSA